MKNKKIIIFYLSISLQFLASEQKYCLPQVSTLFAILQEYDAPLTYMYILRMANQEITIPELISSLPDNLPDESHRSLFQSRLTVAILQRSTLCTTQQNQPVITCHKLKKRPIYPKPPFL